MKFKFEMAKVITSSILLWQIVATIDCPVLECPDPVGSTLLEIGTCFKHDKTSPVQKIYGALCYDSDTAKITDTKSYCPFSYETKEYMWIDERF